MPTRDIDDSFQYILAEQPSFKEWFIHHWSTNEAVATSSCAGASWTGIRALDLMKHVGMNVASDSLLAIMLIGPSPGGMVCWQVRPRQFGLHERIEAFTRAILDLGVNVMHAGTARMGLISYSMPIGYVMKALHARSTCLGLVPPWYVFKCLYILANTSRHARESGREVSHHGKETHDETHGTG